MNPWRGMNQRLSPPPRPADASVKLRGVIAGIGRLLDELERDCSPLAQDPQNSIDYGEGVCDERARIAGILDSLLSPEGQRGTTHDCPLHGVHEHAFRGPHYFHEWDPAKHPAAAPEPVP